MGKTSSSQSAWSLIVSGVSQARLEAHRIRHLITRSEKLVQNSNARDHLYEEAGDIIIGLPKRLSELERYLDRTSYALSLMGEDFFSGRLSLSDRELVNQAIESHAIVKRISAQYLQKLGYKTPNEQAGISTYVTENSKKNLPNDNKVEDNADQREKSGPSAPKKKEQALPIRNDHSKNRDKKPPISQTNGEGTARPQFNTPPHSEKAEGGRPIHKEKIRSRSQEGEQYGTPYKNDGNMPTRRTMESSVKRVAKLYLEKLLCER